MIKVWILLLSLALIWGSSFILMKKALLAFSYTQLASFRLCLAGLSLAPFALKSLRQHSTRKILYAIAVGLIGSTFPAFLFAKAQTVINSATAGILNSITPIFTLLLGTLFFRVKMTSLKIAGVISGFIGAFLILNLKGPFQMHFLYGSLVILATICYAVSTNIMKTYLHEVPPYQIVVIALFFLIPPTGLYLLYTDGFSLIVQHSAGWESFASVSALALIGTAFALILYNTLVQKSNAVFASMVTYLIPVVALMWGLIDQETITFYHLIGTLLILLGVYLVNRDI